jgi:hypothetical protein
MYILTLGLIGLFSLAAWAILELGGPTSLFVDLVHVYSGVFMLIATYYYVAPSAEQLTKIIATLKAITAGAIFRRQEPKPAAPEPTPAAPVQPVQEAAPAAPAASRDPWDQA